MKVKIFLIGCSAILMGLSNGCSKSSPLNPEACDGNSSWAERIQSEIADWSAAITTYSNDPTAANCEKYKTAGVNYLDALEGIRGCVLGASQKAFNEAIDEAKKDLAASDCIN